MTQPLSPNIIKQTFLHLFNMPIAYTQHNSFSFSVYADTNFRIQFAIVCKFFGRTESGPGNSWCFGAIAGKPI